MIINNEKIDRNIKFNTRHGRRKSSGPLRSTTPLDNFLTPGVLFRFPSDFKHLIDMESQIMSATFVSACSPCPFEQGQATFENINLEPIQLEIETTFLINSASQCNNRKSSIFYDSDNLETDSLSSLRSISPVSVSSSINSLPPTVPTLVTETCTKRKRCESCKTRKTPYWRDGWESGILLCNACGIRFHKYRKFCESCHCIAKKDELGRLQCPKCFDKL